MVEYSYNYSMAMATGMAPLYASYGPRRSEVLNPTDPTNLPGPKALALGQRRIFKAATNCSVYRCETKHPQRRLPHCSVWRFGTKHSRNTYEEGYYPAIFSDKKRSIDEAVDLADGLVLAKAVNGSNEEPKRQRG